MTINYMVAGVTTECITAVNYSAFYIILLLYSRIHSEPYRRIHHQMVFPIGHHFRQASSTYDDYKPFSCNLSYHSYNRLNNVVLELMFFSAGGEITLAL